ncbi:plasmid replication protein [Candidatus Magnetomorum sp. HK-1]|nr:plasmid replication protein [Candidatus Magnetomorum sp. HK-1]
MIDNEKVSRIGIYDIMPKYVYEENTNKSEIKRSFLYEGCLYELIISPAMIREGNIYKEFYPGILEERIEYILRNLAKEKSSGVSFSIDQLQKELKKYGIDLDIESIEKSLTILNKTNIAVKNEDFEVSSNILPVYRYRVRENKIFVQFHSLSQIFMPIIPPNNLLR